VGEREKEGEIWTGIANREKGRPTYTYADAEIAAQG
jgi:hypothetical protein